ncbi:nucleoside hydrolase [Shimia sp. R11_0]|uniref:nucleoside hydrolase n=1 Tax=Shimia sp. R11_0 TaxID=2821096 RepID=UPI001FFDEC75|nr:nucleoside hydrolase [Shimia sp. R11_0]
MKLIIDTDPGVDDVIAIALAKTLPDTEVIGLTTVFGNTFTWQSSRNARFLLDLLKWPVPVYEGAEFPLGATSYTPSSNVHGDEGFGDILTVPQIGQNQPESAAEFLVQAARAHPGEVVICALAPLTNIALALELDEAFAKNVGRLVLMGGALECDGNITPYAEANIFHDARAAERVFASGMNIQMIGLDVTLKTLLRQPQIDDLKNHAPVVGAFISEITPFYLDFYRSVASIDGCPMHDAAAILACRYPDRFDFVTTGISVSQSATNLGQTLRASERPMTQVALDLDADWAVQHLFERIGALH